MRKLFTLFAAILCTASMWADVAVNGKLPGAFSVSATKVVYFSQGNLHATTTDLGTNWTWSFAENQYDYIGNATANNAINGNGSVSTNGTVDMFAWSTANTYYGIHNDGAWATYHGDFIDWGTNVITNGGNEANAWRTLTQGEWDYLFNTRTTSARIRKPNTFSTYTDNARYTKATILTDGSGTDGLTFNIVGAILFPDNFNSNVTYSGVSWGMANSINSLYPTTCTTAGWAALEEAGCVFLPAAGYRSSAHVYSGGSASNYWSATPHEDEAGEAYYLLIGSSTVQVRNTGRLGGKAVRLVSETAPPTPATVSTPPTAIDGLEYTGAAQALLNNDGAAEGGTLNYSLDNSTWSSSIPTATNAGDYTVYYMVVGDASHADFTPTENSIAVSIEKAMFTMTADDKWTDYGDTDPIYFTTTYSGLVNGESISVLSSIPTPSCSYQVGDPVGTYEIVLSEGVSDNYDFSLTNGTLHVNKVAVSLTAPEAILGLEYTGAAQTLITAGSATGGEMQYKLGDGAWSTSLPTATDADDYTVWYKVIGDANHNDVAETSIAVSIAAPSALVLTANPDPDPLHDGVYYSTFYHSAIAYELSAGTEAYVATLSGDALILTKIAEGGQVIPMNNAVILKSNSGSITLTPSDATPVTFTATNNLHGVDEPTAAPANCYVLSGHSSDNSVIGVGFYQYTGTLKAHKAYATISGGAAYAPKRLRFVFNATTDVESIQPSEVSSQKVLRNGQLIIIRNGVEYNANGQIVK